MKATESARASESMSDRVEIERARTRARVYTGTRRGGTKEEGDTPTTGGDGRGGQGVLVVANHLNGKGHDGFLKTLKGSKGHIQPA